MLLFQDGEEHLASILLHPARVVVGAREAVLLAGVQHAADHHAQMVHVLDVFHQELRVESDFHIVVGEYRTFFHQDVAMFHGFVVTLMGEGGRYRLRGEIALKSKGFQSTRKGTCTTIGCEWYHSTYPSPSRTPVR